MEHALKGNLLLIICLRNIYVLDKCDFENLILDFHGTRYGRYSIRKKVKNDKNTIAPQLKSSNFEELIAYFMPLILEGFEHNKGEIVGLDNVVIVTARHAILKNLNNLI